MVDRGTLDINKDLSFVDPRIRSQAPVDRMILLPPGFSPTNWDVICQRGKDSYEHSTLYICTHRFQGYFVSDDVC